MGLDKDTVQDTIRGVRSSLDDFDAWVTLSKKAKELMENGVINIDIIKDETLLAILIMETINIAIQLS